MSFRIVDEYVECQIGNEVAKFRIADVEVCKFYYGTIPNNFISNVSDNILQSLGITGFLNDHHNLHLMTVSLNTIHGVQAGATVYRENLERRICVSLDLRPDSSSQSRVDRMRQLECPYLPTLDMIILADYINRNQSVLIRHI
jgi:hypothetical protein